MTLLVFTVLVGCGSFVAGTLGALTGLGGGLVIVPLLTIGFGVDIRHAAGASLVSVIATSSGAAAAFVREGFSNVRIGMFLELATTVGAFAGAHLAAHAPARAISVLFGAMLLLSSAASFLPDAGHDRAVPPSTTSLGARLRLAGYVPTPSGPRAYQAARVPLGFGLMFVAGGLSGLLGIGSGALKVLAMDRAMRLPFKVSTTTSNFMIGVTAAASAGVYLRRGYVDPSLSAPVMLGVLAGSIVGARLLARAPTKVLRVIFAVAIGLVALEMIRAGVSKPS
jgi:uncharacterized membrane protein YfcA